MSAPTPQSAPKPSLSQMLRQHQQGADIRKKENEIRKKAVADSVGKVTESMMDGINFGVARVFANQKKIEQETKVLESQCARFNKITSNWIQMVEQFNDALKEIGDVENWSIAIERDMKEIAAALDYVHKQTPAPVRAGQAN